MTTALVLGSGGVRGLAHVGVLEALEEAGITPDIIAGSSSGAVIGGLYASGKSASEIKTLVEDFQVYKFIDFTNIGGGILKGQKAKIFLKEQLGDVAFDELDTEFFVNALDLNNQDVKILDEGNVVSAVHASMAIPGVFKPVKRDDELLLDAGYVNPLPVQGLPPCDRIILVDVSNSPSDISEDTRFHAIVREFFSYVQHRFQENQVEALSDNQPDTTVTTIIPDTYDWTILSFSELEEIVDRGYEAARDAFDEP